MSHVVVAGFAAAGHVVVEEGVEEDGGTDTGTVAGHAFDSYFLLSVRLKHIIS